MTQPLPARRVLVADDDPDIRYMLTVNLEAEGFKVMSCGDGEEARDLVRSTLPDLVVLDVMMPERDGLDVLASLKANPSTKDIPVVLLTARVSDADVWAGWQSGADYYLTKPFDIDELLRFVDYLLSEPEPARP